MKILFVIARLNVGGTSEIIKNLSEEFIKQNLDILVVHGSVESNEIETNGLDKIPARKLVHMGRRINLIRDIKAFFELRDVIRDYSPDIVFSHTFKAGLLSRLQINKCSKIHVFHGLLFSDSSFMKPTRYLMLWIERFLAKKSDFIVTIGASIATELDRLGIGSPENIVALNPPVKSPIPTKLDTLKSLQNLTLDFECTVGWIGRLEQVKRPLYVMQIARKLPDTLFLICGKGTLWEACNEQSPPNVIMLGWCDVGEFLPLVDIVLNTSESEGMPIALIEAQLCGKPVIAPNVGAISETFLDKVTGFLTQNNVNDIYASLLELKGNETLRMNFGIKAAKYAREKFNEELVAQTYIDLFQRVKFTK